MYVFKEWNLGFTVIRDKNCAKLPKLTDSVRRSTCVWKQLDGFEKAAVDMVKPLHGTTTLAFVFEKGVIVAADSRASMGNYICKLDFFIQSDLARPNLLPIASQWSPCFHTLI